MRAADIMTRDPVRISPDASIAEAIQAALRTARTPLNQFPEFVWPKFEAADQLHEFFELTSTNFAEILTRCNACVAEATKSNIESAFKFAHDFWSTKSPPESVAVYGAYAGRQLEAFATQAQQLSALAQSFTTDTLNSITSVVPRMANWAAASS
jgi:hypothetical protein